MTDHILKSHNKTLFLYHLVCPVKYRRKVITQTVAKTIKDICLEIGERFEIHFVEIGTDEDHVHFPLQSVPMLSPTSIVCHRQESHRQTGLSTTPGSEKNVVGRQVLDQWILYEHRRTIWQWTNHSQLC